MIAENSEIQKLKSLTNSLLISKTKGLVTEERILTALILRHLAEISSRRLYSELGYSSLFTFCVKHLGYTESQTQRRIEAMRALQEMPEIESKIRDGALSLTAVAQAQTYFRSQKEITLPEKKEILKTLENKSTRECEKILLAISPETTLPKEKIKPISITHTQVTLNVPNELLEKIDKIKNLLSHKNLSMSKIQLLEEMAEICLKKLDPERHGLSRRSVSTAPKVNSRYIPEKIKRQIWMEAGGKCVFIGSTGRRCDSQALLEIDHIVPKALGGTNSRENLRLLCRSHNKWAAIQALGSEIMGQYIR
jgi:hypothetical protein